MLNRQFAPVPVHCSLPPDLLDRLARTGDETLRTAVFDMDHYVPGGDVHVNSGIPNHAQRTYGATSTAELPPDQARLAGQALHTLPVTAADAPPHYPDGFQYEIAFSPTDGESRSLVIDEADVSDALRPVIETAMRRGTLG